MGHAVPECGTRGARVWDTPCRDVRHTRLGVWGGLGGACWRDDGPRFVRARLRDLAAARRPGHVGRRHQQPVPAGVAPARRGGRRAELRLPARSAGPAVPDRRLRRGLDLRGHGRGGAPRPRRCAPSTPPCAHTTRHRRSSSASTGRTCCCGCTAPRSRPSSASSAAPATRSPGSTATSTCDEQRRQRRARRSRPGRGARFAGRPARLLPRACGPPLRRTARRHDDLPLPAPAAGRPAMAARLTGVPAAGRPPRVLAPAHLGTRLYGKPAYPPAVATAMLRSVRAALLAIPRRGHGPHIDAAVRELGTDALPSPRRLPA